MNRCLGTLFFSVVLATLAAGIFTSCDGKKDEEAGPPETVLAQVNDRYITPDDLLISIDLLYPPMERPRYTSPQGRAQALQQLIVMELFYQEGVAQGLEQDKRLERIMDNYKRYLIFHTLMNRGISPQVVSGFIQTNFVHVAIIFLKKAENASDKVTERLRKSAQKIHKQLEQGTEFAELAKKYSDHPSSQNGGDIGAITRSERWEPQMTDAAMALTEEAPLSPVIETPSGFYIVKLINPRGKIAPEQMTGEIQQNILAHLISQNYATYAAQLQTQARVQINTEVLENMPMWQPSGPEGSFLPALMPEGIPRR